MQATFAARARTDARDWLIEADEPLAGLQLRNGGELPGPIVAPDLLQLVRKARNYRFRLARMIDARDESENVRAWVEVEPDTDGSGCVLSLSGWISEPVSELSLEDERERQLSLVRQLAGLVARLGPDQEMLAVESECCEISELVTRMRESIGLPWTDFVTLAGNGHKQPMHWRLLDGAGVTLEGSMREWRAHLVPLGKPTPGSAGFELYLVPDRPMPDQRPAEDTPTDGRTPGIGLEIAPVLRQPVSRIIANAETIRTQLAGPLADEYSNYAADITAAGEHLLALIDDLTTLEMVEDENFEPAPDQIDLADVARRAAGILGVRASERGVNIDVPGNEDRAPAIGEFRRVLQVLLNLLGNAIRYSPEGSQVWLRVDSNSDVSRVTVADQGEGLDEDQQGRVFGKFERLGRQGDGGSGLGLYISRRLAEAMGGTLEVESARGQGARFTLQLPADKDASGEM